ncbi:MAG: response regulator [Planctomycetota bacterium]
MSIEKSSTEPVRAPQDWRQVDPREFRILIADDLEDTRYVIRKSLTKIGYQVSEAQDGREVLELARAQQPDLLILDIMMPDIDGLSALREIRSDPRLRSAYVIMLTGKSSLKEKIEGLELGADDYVTKPFMLSELKARVLAGIRLKAVHRSLCETQEIVVRREKLATIGALAAGVAHEFNNIMGSISGYAQLARSNAKFTERLITAVLEQSDRAQKITSSLITYASSSAEGRGSIAIGRSVEAASCLLSKELRQKCVDLQVKLTASLPPVHGHEGQLQQVLIHLLLNALQAVGKDGRIEVRGSVQGRTLRLEVDDNGPGIPEQHRHRIFDPFFTTKGPLGQSEQPGTGLGLTFSQNIIHAHQGTLTLVESQLGGACLRIELPLANQQAVVKPLPEAPPVAVTTHATRPGRVVLVEDDPTVQELVCALLENHPPHVFDSGRPALEYCRANPPDVVILDLGLNGDLDGRQVLAGLRAVEPTPLVIITTGSIAIASLADIEYPDLKILPKPFRLHELERALELPVRTG